MPTVKPLDGDLICEAARSTGVVVTTEEHSIFGGLGGAVAEVLCECLPLPVLRLGMRDTFGESAPNDALLEKYGLSVAQTAEAIAAFVESPSHSSNRRSSKEVNM
jgi:transketolase